jgi:TetR/AcrR family transcriptional repressor of nem operon
MRDAGLTHGGFYKHFASKEELLNESLEAAFRETCDRLSDAAEHAPRDYAWKAIVKSYLSLEHCEHTEFGCPLAALAPDLSRADKTINPRILKAVTNYRARMVPFMPGRRAIDKERAFLTIFSTMIGAIAIARIQPNQAAREEVLASARNFLFRSF